MTGKYIEFTSAASGQVIRGKNKFCIRTGLLSYYKLGKLKGKNKEGQFVLGGVLWTFRTVYANPETRTYIPNVTGTKEHKIPAAITYTKQIGNMEMVYSAVSHRLMCTRQVG